MKTLHFLIAGLRPASSIAARRIAFSLLFLGAGLVLTHPCAGQSGTWTETGSLATGRFGHTATLLPNGKVLVAGGDYGVLASAELYDPASGTWTATGGLPRYRLGHTATLLPNGKVLVAGGLGNYYLTSAGLYDPASGTWTRAGHLANARYLHTATLLPNGKVLVAGGDYGVAIASAELYDPASGTWTATGSLATAREAHTATLLPNGKVLVAGGYDRILNPLASAELYDPATGTWTATDSLNTARAGHTATLLPNGKVLVVGGPVVASAELYDPESETWTATGSLATARYYHTATLLPNGEVLVAAGNLYGALASAELYDPASGTWTATGSLATARFYHTATLLSNGVVLVAGGVDSNITPLSSAELYTPSGGGTCLFPPTGLVSWWSGDRTADDVQGLNPGVLLNGASFTKGKVGPGFVFDGVDDWVRIPNSPSLHQTRITLDAWIYSTGRVGTNRHIISKDNDAKTREFVLGLGYDNQFVADVWLPTGLVSLYQNTTITQLNTWYHVAMTHDGTTLRLYVNGVLDGAIDAVGDIVTTDNPVGIGGNVVSAVSFKGIIDEAQIFDRVLTDAEILAIYQAGAAGECKPDIFVGSITPSYEPIGSRFLVSTSIVIQDENGNGIEDASLQMKIILPSGSVLAFPATTDATGQATISFSTEDSGLYKFKVLKVTHPTRKYDRSLNIETTDTLVIP